MNTKKLIFKLYILFLIFSCVNSKKSMNKGGSLDLGFHFRKFNKKDVNVVKLGYGKDPTHYIVGGINFEYNECSKCNIKGIFYADYIPKEYMRNKEAKKYPFLKKKFKNKNYKGCIELDYYKEEEEEINLDLCNPYSIGFCRRNCYCRKCGEKVEVNSLAFSDTVYIIKAAIKGRKNVLMLWNSVERNYAHYFDSREICKYEAIHVATIPLNDLHTELCNIPIEIKQLFLEKLKVFENEKIENNIIENDDDCIEEEKEEKKEEKEYELYNDIESVSRIFSKKIRGNEIKYISKILTEYFPEKNYKEEESENPIQQNPIQQNPNGGICIVL